MVSYWQGAGGGQFLLKLGNAGMHVEAHRSGLSREESSEEPESGQGEDLCWGQNCGWNSSQEICRCSPQSIFAMRFGSQHRKKDGPLSLMPFLQAAAVLGQRLTCLHLRAGPPRKDHHTQSCAFHSILSHSSRQGLFHSLSLSVELREHDLNVESDVML